MEMLPTKTIAEALKAYIDKNPFDLGGSNCENMLDQLYQAYAESRKSDPPEIQAEFVESVKLVSAWRPN